MKNKTLALLYCTLLLFGTGYSQSPSASEIRSKMWDSDAEEFAVQTTPEKWQNEDAVILALSQERAYRKPALSSSLIEEISFHERTKILSKAALEEYGQFTFKKSRTMGTTTLVSHVGFKIIKPDGTEIIVNQNEAVEEKFEVNNEVQFSDMKLAIPNLEVGDIIDYYFYYHYKFFAAKFYSFDPAIFLLQKRYPTVYGSIKFAVLRRCFINLKTSNGAPPFVKSDENDEEDTYLLEYRDQEKSEPLPWFYPYRSLPTVKFKVTYSSSMGVYQVPNLLDKLNPGKLNSSVSNSDMAGFMNEYMARFPDFTGLIKYMKPFKKESDEVKVRMAFYHQRHHLSVKYQENRTIRGNNGDGISSAYMISNLSKYFKKAGISHAYIVGVSNAIGHVDDLVLEEEIILGLKVFTNPTIYIGSFTAHSLANELNQSLSGAEVLISNDLRLENCRTFVKEALPTSQADDNQAETTITFALDPGKKSQKLNTKRNQSGLFRFGEQAQLMDFYDYQNEEVIKYKMDPILQDLTGKRLKETKKLLSEYQESRDRERLKNLKEVNEVQFDFEIDSVHSFNILETGRSSEAPSFEYEYVIETEDLINKAGNNYIVSIGKLIEKQVEIDNEFKEARKYDIYMNYPRTYKSAISMTVPEGYEVQGLEKLNNSINNETGGFQSTATFSNNTLRLSTVKYYSRAQEPAKNWFELLKFVEAAEDFSDYKVLLKKK